MKPKRPRSTGGCAVPRTGGTPTTYAEVVAQYIACDQHRGDGELAWFSGLPDYETLLEKAVMSRTSQDQRHPHQRRIPEAALRKAHRALSRSDLQSCGSFADLHNAIDAATESIPKIGPLAVFDFACRIGAWRKPPLQPELVYLHSGTRVGAAALGLARGRQTLHVHELPKAFHRLSARHAEDCLCIYKDELKRIASRSAR